MRVLGEYTHKSILIRNWFTKTPTQTTHYGGGSIGQGGGPLGSLRGEYITTTRPVGGIDCYSRGQYDALYENTYR